jgi:hypothetical protein
VESVVAAFVVVLGLPLLALLIVALVVKVIQ